MISKEQDRVTEKAQRQSWTRTQGEICEHTLNWSPTEAHHAVAWRLSSVGYVAAKLNPTAPGAAGAPPGGGTDLQAVARVK